MRLCVCVCICGCLCLFALHGIPGIARVILAVAPPSLLRADVMAFMEAQTDDDQALIDYREFIISGKVHSYCCSMA